MDFNLGFNLADATTDEVVTLLQRRVKTRSSMSVDQVIHDAGRNEVLEAIAQHARVPYVEGIVDHRDKSLTERLQMEMLRRSMTVPIKQLDGQMTVALANPYEHSGVDYLRQQFREVTSFGLVMSPAADIESVFGLTAASKDMREAIESLTEVDMIARSAIFNLNTEYSEPILEILRQMFNQAVAARASDIHIWTESNDVLKRAYRVAGQLCLHEELSSKLIPRLDAVLMSLLGIDRQIAFSGKAIDSRVSLQSGNRMLPVRYARTPAYHGYHITLRLFGQANVDAVIGQGNLRFLEPELLEIERALESSDGMIAIVGATGSGKSTTLSAMLKRLASNKSELTMTLENPVEQEVPGVIHQSMNEERDFDMMIKSLVRSDPDNIMIGEIRDHHTCMKTLELAITGHLVLTTMHATNAIDALTRFRTWSVPIFDLVRTMRLIMAQKLVRLVCEHCGTARVITDREMDIFRLDKDLRGFEMRAAKEGGCDRCFHRGYADVAVIAEVVPFDERISMSVTDPERVAFQVEAAVREHYPGLSSLKKQGLDLIRSGKTDLNAVKQVVYLAY